MGKIILEIKSLKINFYNEDSVKTVVRNLSLKVEEKEIVALVGGSGSGKTITALSIMRLLPNNCGIEGGQIIFEGKDLLRLSEDNLRKLRGAEIGFVFQEPLSALNPLFNIGCQIGEVLRFHSESKRNQIVNQVLSLIKKVEIPDPEKAMGDYPHQLSAGLRQRAVIAQAIAMNPKLLIADEPTSNLDVTVQAKIMDLFLNLRKEMNISILLITHDLALVEHFADKVAVISEGGIVEFGPTRDVLNNPQSNYTKLLMEAVRIS